LVEVIIFIVGVSFTLSIGEVSSLSSIPADTGSDPKFGIVLMVSGVAILLTSIGISYLAFGQI
jgi:hypothetical protein